IYFCFAAGLGRGRPRHLSAAQGETCIAVTMLVMHQRSAIRNWIEYALASAALESLEIAPLGMAQRLARLYTRILDRAVPRLRDVAEQNLALALPHEDPTRIIDGVFESIARMLLTFARMP